MRFVGIDIHKTFAEVAVIEPGKQGMTRMRVPASPAGLQALADSLSSDDHVVLESTVNTWAVAELLRRTAGRVVVSNPMRTKAIASAKVKTDKVDATTLAELLAADYIPDVWQPDEYSLELRRQIGHRASLVQQTTRLRNRIQCNLMRNLQQSPFSDAFGASGRQWLDQVELPVEERRQVDSTLRQLDFVQSEIEATEKVIARTVLSDARIQRLMTIPGMGMATAAALIAVIGDISRFPRPNQLVGYLGLDPRVRQSGNRPAFTGHISRQGDATLRWLLVEAGHAASRTPGPLRAFFQRVRARRGTAIAAVAVARKLAILAWHLLTKEEEYRWKAPVRVAAKMRLVEIKAGAPKTKRGRPGLPRAAGYSAKRQEEYRRWLAAEQEYRDFIRRRLSERRDAAAANGEATLTGRAAEVASPASALLPGVDRALVESIATDGEGEQALARSR